MAGPTTPVVGSLAGSPVVTEATELPDMVSLTFPAAPGDTVEERIGFPFIEAEVEAIHLGAIGARGTGSVKVEKGMVSGGNTLLVGPSFDVSTLGADNVVEALGLTSTSVDLQGGELDVLTLSFVNCTVPHLIKIQFKRQ